MALQFQPPNFGPPASKYAALNETLGKSIANLPELLMEYNLKKKQNEIALKQLEIRNRQLDQQLAEDQRSGVAQYGTGAPLPTTVNELPGTTPTPQEQALLAGAMPETQLPLAAQPTPLDVLKSIGIQRYNSLPRQMVEPPVEQAPVAPVPQLKAAKPAPLSPYEATKQREKAKAEVKAQIDLSKVRPMVEGVLSEISRVQELNKNSYGGAIGGATFKVKSLLNKGKDDPTFKNTADVVNTMQAQVAQVLKSTFGGQLSDSERMYLNQVYGALPNMSQVERDIAMTNVQLMISEKLKAAESTYGALTGKPAQPTPGGNPMPVQFSSDVIEYATKYGISPEQANQIKLRRGGK
jgi:hypothetical protein